MNKGEKMILDGFLIMLIGMTTVFLFLALLAFLVSLFPLIFQPISEQSSESIPPTIPVPAIVAAAVNYYFNQKKKRS